MTYLWPQGTPLTVRFEADWTPRQFIWQDRAHPVQAVINRWRVDQAWWGRRIWREYFKLTTRTGLLVIIYRDLLTGQWYLQRLYD